MTEYTRTVEDDLDWSLLDQLHAVVLQIGTFCFRTKQICLTILIGAIGLIIALTSDKLDTSIFVAGIVIPVAFWFLDSIAYFYQIKLRGLMESIREEIKQRHSKKSIVGQNSEVITKERISASQVINIKNAFFNHSMWLYYILVVIDRILWGAFTLGTIQ